MTSTAPTTTVDSLNDPCEKYHCTIETLHPTLERYGVAIIPNVLDEHDCEAMENGMWQTLSHLTSKWPKADHNKQPVITKDNPKSWKEIERLNPIHSMLLQNWSIGHAQYLWDLRSHPNIVSIFAHFWHCPMEDLLVSFDAVSYGLPPEVTGFGWHSGEDKFHVDQSFVNSEFQCVQSWVTARDVNSWDATLHILEGSHLLHAPFQERYQKHQTSDWYQLHGEELRFFTETCPKVRIACPKGSMVLWDSRTVHSGTEPLHGRPERNIRNIAYVCYMPRDLCPPNVIQQRISAFQEMRMTSHWPNKAHLFPLTPRKRSMTEVTPLPKPTLTPLGRRLVGFDE